MKPNTLLFVCACLLIPFSALGQPTDTPTPTATPTDTATPTPTSTDTPTSTITPTGTATPWFTITPIITPPATFTPTAVSTPTSTSTPSLTATPSPTRPPTPSPTPTGRVIIQLWESAVTADCEAWASVNVDGAWDVDEPDAMEVGDWTSRPVNVSSFASGPRGSASSNAQSRMSYEMEYDEANEVFSASIVGQINASAITTGEDAECDGTGYFRVALRFSSPNNDVEYEYDIQGLIAGMNAFGNVHFAEDRWELPCVYNTQSQITIEGNGVTDPGYSREFRVVFYAKSVDYPVDPVVCPSANLQVEVYFTLRVKDCPVYYWTDEGATIDWADGDNWDQDRVPPDYADTVFELPGAHTVFVQNESANSVHLTNGTVAFAGGELTLNESNTGEYSLAVDGGGHLDWLMGDLATYSTGIGLETPGEMVFDGSGTWQNRGPRLDIGVNSPGQLTVEEGTVTTPAGGSDAFVGIRSNGNLNVVGEGTFITESLVIGEQQGSVGLVYVDGEFASLESRNTAGNRFEVGSEGGGYLSIDNEAVVEAGELRVGRGAHGIGIVTVEDDASLTITSDDYRPLVIGQEGHGQLSLNYGGSVGVMDVGTALTLAEGLQSEGVVYVGQYSTLDTGHMAIGVQGAAEMEIQRGEASCTSADVAPWDTALLESVARVKDDGKWLIDNDLTIGGRGGLGFVFISENSLIEAGSVLVDEWGTLILNPPGNPTVKASSIGIETDGNLIAYAGTLMGTVSVNGGTVYISPLVTQLPKPLAGEVTVASATLAGGVKIAGDLVVSPTGTLVIEVNGTSAVSATSPLAVTGTVTLDGVLDLRFVDGYAPGANDVLPLIACDGALGGEFSDVWISGLQEDFEYALNTDGGGLELIALNDGEALVPGDMNSDGTVDCLDLFLFADHWQEPRAAANLNCNLTGEDSRIDEEDLLLLLQSLQE